MLRFVIAFIFSCMFGVLWFIGMVFGAVRLDEKGDYVLGKVMDEIWRDYIDKETK